VGRLELTQWMLSIFLVLAKGKKAIITIFMV
jgi:hypothetical protein